MFIFAAHNAAACPTAVNAITAPQGDDMKVYIVTEYSENILRFATLDKELVQQIVDAFPHCSLRITEMNLIGTEK